MLFFGFSERMAPMDLETIKEALDRPGKSKGGLAQALGRSPAVVTSILKGERPIKLEEIPKIEGYLGIGSRQAVVRVVGYVGAGAGAHYYALSPDDLEAVPAPPGATPNTVAVEIRGASLGPHFDHWLAFYDDVRRPLTEDLIGHLCVIGLSDERVLIKKVEKGAKKGLFRLLSNVGEAPIENVPIEWAARVRNMMPR